MLLIYLLENTVQCGIIQNQLFETRQFLIRKERFPIYCTGLCAIKI